MADNDSVEAQSQDSTVTDSLPTGEASGGTPESTTTQSAGATAPSGKSFFSHGEHNFKDAAELSAYFDKESENARRERMNLDDYNQRISSYNEERKAHQEAVKNHEATVKQWASQQKQMEDLDNLLKQRPDVQGYIQQLLGQAPSADTVTQRGNAAVEEAIAKMEAKYAPLLEAHQKAEDEKATESQLQEIFSDTKILPNGTDEARVRETLDAIENAPNPAKELAVLVARMYAREKPAAQQNGQGGRRRIQSNGSVPTTDKKDYKGMTNEQIQEAQLQELGY